MRDQLSLFDEADDAGSRASLDAVYAEAQALAARLPPELWFGTSSWSFPGWSGFVYSRARTTSELAREGLREYAKHPLLKTVGIDRSYYAPMSIADLRAYADQLPSGFRCAIKAPAAVTGYALGPPSDRATLNPDFLSVDRLVDDLLEPLAAAFRAHTGPIILEIPPFSRGHRLEPARFVERLARFLAAVPRDFEYAVELRDPTLLTSAYRVVLDAHGTGHTYNYWSAMPTPGEQAAVVPIPTGPFVVVRLLLKPGTWYEDQRDAFRPFNRLVAPDPRMRREVTALVRQAVAAGKRVYVLVNNKAEGSSPLTVMALARAMVEPG